MKLALMIGKLRTPLDEGTGKSVLNLAKKLDDRVEEVIIFTRASNDKKEDLAEEEIIKGIRVLRRPIKPRTFFSNRRLLKKESIDILHVHSSSAKMALYSSKLCSNTVWTIPAYRSNFIDETLWRIGSSQQVVATSENLKKLSPANKTLPYGIDIEEHNIQRNPKSKDLDVLYMGAPNQKRGFFSSIETVESLKKKNENVNFWVAVRERNNQKQRAKQIIKKKGIDDITRVRGFIDDLPEFYNKMDVVLNPIKDSSGITSPPIITLEAMSCGRIVCCTKIPDFRKVIEDNESGLLFEYGDEESLAKRITELEQKEFDDISRRAREDIIENYSWDYITEEYLELYREIIDG